MQPPLALGRGEFVGRLGEVVHTDIDVARFGKPANGQLQDLQLGLARRQLGIHDASLGLEQAGQVSVVVDGQTIRREGQDLLKRPVEADDVLLGEAVDQIHTDRLETMGTGCVDDQLGLFLALHPIDGLLHIRVEILDADAHAVEAQLGKQRNGGFIHLAGVDLNGVLAIRHQRKVLLHDRHQLAQLVVGQEGGRAPAQVKLQDFPRPLQAGNLEINFLFQIIQVLGRATVVLRDDLVAGAVVADRIAEGDVEV